QASNASFDAATFEIWGALLNGAQLVGVSQDTALSPHGLSDFLRAESITALFLTTALFNQIALLRPDAFSSLRYLLFGGEACDPRCVRRVLESAPPQHLLHVYGPTENTTFSTWHRVDRVAEDAVTVPIGRPIANTQCYVLAEDLQPAPLGVPGELYVGGAGLARGYYRRPDLSGASFVANPFHESDTLYRTGDLVRRLNDGSIEFIGRKDGQIKLRGFRIELGEIESALHAVHGVRECCVVLRDEDPGDKQIVAYIVPEQAGALESASLRASLGGTLPEYMVPRAIVFMEALPLTPNGKVDKRALPAPGHDASDALQVVPRTALEADIARLWSDVLGGRGVGVTDRFFDVGGHSLLAVRIMAMIRDRYEVDFPLTRFFQDPTVSGMAAYIQQQQGVGAPGSQTPFTLVPIQPQGERCPLFCVATAGGVLFPYFNLAPLLGANQPLYGLQDPALEGNRAPFDTVEELAAHYIEVMRTQQPAGPYLLCGWSYGGTVAFEMARQLREQGNEVGLLVIIDAMQAPPDLSVKGGIGAFLRVWLRRARIFILNTYHLRPYIVDGLYLVFRRKRARRKEGEVAVGDYFRWACTDVVLKHAGIANVVSRDSLLMMKVPAFRRIFKVLHANGEAWKRYVTKPYDGRITVFRAEVQPPELVGNETLGWGEVALGGVDVHVIPGYHSEILGVGIPHCAEHLAQCLDRIGDGQHRESLDARSSGTIVSVNSLP
ncbi:MAG: non-ribosomal peptide synthetase, partial [Candidatus Hydrogenedentes bacterium]|nr:non-ribosomal peptide synthetase [Candidatus Hydrogenedentota bacterium]